MEGLDHSSDHTGNRFQKLNRSVLQNNQNLYRSLTNNTIATLHDAAIDSDRKQVFSSCCRNVSTELLQTGLEPGRKNPVFNFG